MSASKPLDPLPREEHKDPRPLLVLLIVLCSIMVVTYALRLDQRDRIEASIVAQKAANAAAVARGAELEKNVAEANRPAYLDVFIRTYLGMGKSGDIRLVPVDTPESGEVAAAPPPVAPVRMLPVWQQWVMLFWKQTGGPSSGGSSPGG